MKFERSSASLDDLGKRWCRNIEFFGGGAFNSIEVIGSLDNGRCGLKVCVSKAIGNRFQSEDGDNAGCASNHDDMSEESSDIQGINCLNDNLLVSWKCLFGSRYRIFLSHRRVHAVLGSSKKTAKLFLKFARRSPTTKHSYEL